MFVSRFVSVAVLVALTHLTATSVADDDFPELTNSEADQSAQPMPADVSAKSFEVPEGFRVDVFAAEPDVQNPIAMTWDSQGRLWIAENFTYAERSQRFDLSLRDRVLIFEDADQDGRAEKRTVFTDNVQMLTSLEVGHGGVWMMCPSQLLFLPDANLDDQPDSEPIVVLDGFEVAKENYHNYANGLKWGPDGWLYGRCGGSCPGRIGKPGTPDDQRVALEGGIWRYHPVTERFEVLCHGTTNPWGHDWNQFGDGFFVNTVNGHLWQIIPGAHYVRPFTLDPNPSTYELIDMHADHWHFDTGASWTKSRAGAANSFGGGHAHSGASIYLGNNWPQEYQGNLLTLNFHGRRINREILKLDGSGYTAAHGEDMFIAADPFFRGMDLSYGPNGAVYVLDWSDTGECHEHTGVHRTSGRIFKISYETDFPSRPIVGDLREKSTGELLRFMNYRNEWPVRQARLILAERAAAGEELKGKQLSYLRSSAMSGSSQIAIRALMMLYVTGAVDSSYFARKSQAHKSEKVRAFALSTLADQWPLDDVFGPQYMDQDALEVRARAVELHFDDLARIAKNDGSAKVQLALASILQRLPLEYRADLASVMMSHPEFEDDHNLPLLVWYGLMPVADKYSLKLADAAIASRWPKTQRLIVRRLAEQIDLHPEAVDKVLAATVNADDLIRETVLLGLADGLRGWSQAKAPMTWEPFAAAIRRQNQPELNSVVTDLSVVFGDGRALDHVRKTVQDNAAEINLRRSALKTLVSSDDPAVAQICLPLLSDPRLNTIAALGVGNSSHEEAATALIKNYRRFRAPNRSQVIEILVSRPSFAKALLDAVANEKIPSTDLTAFDVRQIRSLGQPELVAAVSKLWGNIRDTSAAKQRQIETLKAQLSPQILKTASAARGRALFNKSCSKCHRMFGYGESIGPDLTGANRSNMDYLLENIIAPSSVVSKDYRMTIVIMNSGQVFNGLLTSRNQRTLTLQTQNELKTISLDDIEETTVTSSSPMPDGLLDNLNFEQIRDLIWYLQQPVQVEAAL